MKRFEIKNLLLFICLFITTIGIAQTQHGYVKTRGRLDSKGKLIPGKGLKGATVFIKGRTSVLVKDTTGAFSFPTPAKQFRVDSVRKNGYQLVDLEFCYKTRNYSSTPLDILMEVPGQSIEDYMEDFNKINASQQAMINQLRAEVKELKAQNKINEVEYNRRLSEIASMQSENQKLVKEMAERYSRMDFDRLDDFEKQVSWLILNGELIKADSLIRSKGSMEKRSAELDQLHQANMEVRADLEKSEALEAKTLEDFAADCYNLYEICKLRHVNDSAAYWLELRASKDTTNVEWLNETAAFYLECNQFQKAESYLNKSLEIYRELEKDNPCAFESDIAYTYTNLGNLYTNTSLYNAKRYDEAESSFNEALSIFRRLAKDNPKAYKLEISMVLNDMGVLFYCSKQFKKCENAYLECLAIRRQLVMDYPQDYDKSILANVLVNIGLCYSKMGRRWDSESSYNEAITIFRQLTEESPFDDDYKDGLALVFISIGNLYFNTQRYDASEKAYLESLEIYRQLAEKNTYYEHNLAMVLRDYGYVLYELKHVEESEIAYIEALEILHHLATDNPNTYKVELATTLNIVGTYYRDTQQFEKSKVSYNEALEIYKALSEYEKEIYQSKIIDIYANLGILYEMWEDKDK